MLVNCAARQKAQLIATIEKILRDMEVMKRDLDLFIVSEEARTRTTDVDIADILYRQYLPAFAPTT